MREDSLEYKIMIEKLALVFGMILFVSLLVTASFLHHYNLMAPATTLYFLSLWIFCTVISLRRNLKKLTGE